jgi:hypothetical protein
MQLAVERAPTATRCCAMAALLSGTCQVPYAARTLITQLFARRACCCRRAAAVA